MKRCAALWIAAGMIWAAVTPPAMVHAADNATAQMPIAHAQEKADADRQQALREAALKEAESLFVRSELQGRIDALQQAQKEQQELLELLNTRYHANDKEIARLQKRIEEQEGSMNEVSGTVRAVAQDAATVLRRSLVSGQFPHRDQLIEPLLSELEFPSLDVVRQMADAMFGEIEHNGRIATTRLKYVDASGRQVEGDVVRVGAFNALCRQGDEVAYLQYAPAKQMFHQLIVDPPAAMQRSAEAFVSEQTENLHMDLSCGGAYRQLTDMPGWYEQLKAGGALMYPLVIVGLVAIILMIERLVVLYREGKSAGELSRKITGPIQSGRWEEALALCQNRRGTLGAVLKAGIGHRQERPEVLESVMEEAIQSTLPRLERSMSPLQILGMVAPLIGLLGTVTGMIATFQMITLYGTGDPKIMSGGISEALVTTQYGLIVAIPIILVHGYFQGRIDRIVGMLEEKAIMLVNAVKKQGEGQA